MKKVTASWQGGMAFEAVTGSGHTLLMDAGATVGGEDKGARPTELLLAALGGCTGMDVVSILRKMRIPFDRFEVAVEAEEVKEHPKAFASFDLVYRLWGEAVPPDKFVRAVTLSQEKYCGVSALFRHGAGITYRLELNGQTVDNDEEPAP